MKSNLSSGVLLPALGKRVPTELPYPNKCGSIWEPTVLQGLVSVGALKLSDKVEYAVETGFRRLFGKTIGTLDDEMDVLYGCTDDDPTMVHITLNSPYYPGCEFYWGSFIDKLTCSARRLDSPELPAWGIQYLIKHPLLGGPFAWNDIVQYVSEPEAHMDSTEDDEDEFDMNRLVGADKAVAKYLKTFSKLQDRKIRKSDEEMISFLEKRRSSFGPLFRSIATTPIPSCFSDGGILWSAGWKQNDIVEHLWHFLFQLIHEGSLEMSDPPVGTASGTVAEIASNAGALGLAADAITNLNNYVIA